MRSYRLNDDGENPAYKLDSINSRYKFLEEYMGVMGDSDDEVVEPRNLGDFGGLIMYANGPHDSEQE